MPYDHSRCTRGLHLHRRGRPIIWAVAGITGDSDVSTTGLPVGAFDLVDAGVASTTANGVTFDGLALDRGERDLGRLHQFANWGVTPSNALSSGSDPFSSLSSPQRNLLSSYGGVQGGQLLTLTISDLMLGEIHEFQR